MPFTDLQSQGGNIAKLPFDPLQAVVSGLRYQGPAATLYVWAGVLQGGIVRYEEYDVNGVPQLQTIVVPASPSMIPVSQNVTINMRARQNPDQLPVHGASADGIVLVLSEPAMVQANWLLRKTVLGAYTINPLPYLAASGLVANPRLLGGASFVDFSWQQGSGDTPIDQQFLDLVVAGSVNEAAAAFAGAPGVDYFNFDVFGLSGLSSIEVSPGWQMFWRINTHYVIEGWHSSELASFVAASPAVGGGPVSVVGDLTAAFS